MTEPTLNPIAALLAWVFPGLGHIAMGQRKRGFLVMAGLGLMILTGLLVGGIDSVDRRNDRLWFLAQAGCGPIAFGVDLANQRLVQTLSPDPADYVQEYRDRDPEVLEALRRRGLGRVNEMGTLFVALAGLMNLIVVLDCLYHKPPVDSQPYGRRKGD